MKQKLFFASIIFGFALTANAQKPFEEIGLDNEVEVLTVSDGRYVEYFTNDTLRRIGSVMFNTITNKVEYFIPQDDTTYGAELNRAKEASRFMSVDPLTKKYPELTPYQYASNRPIDGIDLDGLEHVRYYYKQKADGTYTQLGPPKALDVFAKNSQGYGVQVRLIGLDGKVKDVFVPTNAPPLPPPPIKPEEKPAEEPFEVGFMSKLEAKMTGSSDNSMEGEQGLKDYSKGLNNTGLVLTVDPLTAPLGKVLMGASDVIDSGLDFKNKDFNTAAKNTGIRLASFFLGEKLGEKLKGAGKDLQLGAEVGLDKAKEAVIDNNAGKETNVGF